MRGSRSFFGIACWVSAAACARGGPAAPVVDAAADDAGLGAASSPPPAVDAGVDASLVEGVAAAVFYQQAAPISGKAIGHTSVVFKLKLEGGVDVAYKPRSAHGGRRYRGEVAAYRLALALRLPNVPYATIRVFDYGALSRAVGSEAVFGEVVKDGSQVRGALIQWVKNLDFPNVDTPAEIHRWQGWLRAGGDLPDDQRVLASQIATMLAFDYVTGNWDRWSGGNVGIAPRSAQLLFIDNDGAFFDPVPTKEMKRGVDLFTGVDRFSRDFVTALREVDLARTFGDEVPGEPLLTPRVLAQTEARRKAALAIIDAKIAKLGESTVLAFP